MNDKMEQLKRQNEAINSPTWPYVLAFARRMEAKLAKNRHKGDREGWLKDDPWSLVERILDETAEVQQCFTAGSDGRVDFKDAEELANECADVANFCMMVADVVTASESNSLATPTAGINLVTREEHEALKGFHALGEQLNKSLTSERDQLRAQLTAATQRAEKAEHAKEEAYERIRELLADKEKAEAACAEMRGVLAKARWMDWREYDGGNHFEIANVFRHDMEHALSTDCGKGYVKKEA